MADGVYEAGAFGGDASGGVGFTESYMGDDQDNNPYIEELNKATELHDQRLASIEKNADYYIQRNPTDYTKKWWEEKKQGEAETFEETLKQLRERYGVEEESAADLINYQGASVTGNAPVGGWSAFGGGGGALPSGGGSTGSGSISGGTSSLQSGSITDIVRMGEPPVDDPITGMAAEDSDATSTDVGGSAGKDFLQQISEQGLTNTEEENLRRRIRTQQAIGGLAFGGAAAKQEIGIVGQYTQQGRLRASTQLASLTEQESKVGMSITRLLGESDKYITSAAQTQLTTPVASLSSLYGGSSAGLNSIFGLNQLF